LGGVGGTQSGDCAYRIGWPEGAAGDGDVAEVVDDGHFLEGAGEAFDGFHLVGAFIDAAIEPVHEGVAPGVGVVEVDGADEIAFGGEGETGGVVGTAEGVPLNVGAVGVAGPDAGGEAFADERAVFLFDVVVFAAVAPVEAAIGVELGAVDVGGVAGVVEAGDDFFPLVGDAVVVGVGEFPEAGRGADVEAAVEPAGALREGHFVGEDGGFVEGAVGVGVFEQEDPVGGIFVELGFVPVHADGVADEESALVIEAAHDGVGDEGRGGGEGEGEARGEGVGDFGFRILDFGLGDGDD
jgi:hypothetical protein